MDEVIFEEFKGTGNMELQLDRKISNRRIYPAVYLVASSTRREDLLLDKEYIQRIISLWVPGEGFPFEKNQIPSLQGTEMWLSILFIISKYLNLHKELHYSPKGVHRIEIAATLNSTI